MKAIFALGVLGAISNCKLTTGSRYDSDDQYDLQIFGNLGNLGLPVSPNLIRTQTANTQPLQASFEETNSQVITNQGNENNVYGNSNVNIKLTEPQSTKISQPQVGFGGSQEFGIQNGYAGQGGIGVQNGYSTQGAYGIQGAFGLSGLQGQKTGFEGYSISQGRGLNNQGLYQNLFQNSYSQNPKQTISSRPQTGNLRYDSFFPSYAPYLPQVQQSQPKVKQLSGVSINENGDQVKYTYTQQVVQGYRSSY